LFWGVARGSCSGEGVALGRECCSGEGMLLCGAREMLGGGKIKLPQSKLGL